MEDKLFERAPEQTLEAEEVETRIMISGIPTTEQAKGKTMRKEVKVRNNFGQEKGHQLIEPVLGTNNNKTVRRAKD